MAARYTYSATLAWGGDTPTGEAEIGCSYAVTWGAPARGPSYASGGEPADLDEIDDIRIVTVDGKLWTEASAWEGLGLTFAEATETLIEKLYADHSEAMLDEAVEQYVSARDEWDDLRRQEREEDQRYWSERADLDDGL